MGTRGAILRTPRMLFTGDSRFDFYPDFTRRNVWSRLANVERFTIVQGANN